MTIFYVVCVVERGDEQWILVVGGASVTGAFLFLIFLIIFNFFKKYLKIISLCHWCICFIIFILIHGF